MELQKIDTDRPYSTVYGNPGVRYEQDGIDYDTQGIQVLDMSKVILSKESRQAYKGIPAAERAMRLRKLNPERYKLIKFRGGYAIYDTQK